MKTCRRVCVTGALITSTWPEDSWTGGEGVAGGEGQRRREKIDERKKREERDEEGNEGIKIRPARMEIRMEEVGRDDRE